MIKYLIAIVIVEVEQGKFEGKKYRHNIKDTEHYIRKFCHDMRYRWITARHINFYYKQSGAFKEKIIL